MPETFHERFPVSLKSFCAKIKVLSPSHSIAAHAKKPLVLSVVCNCHELSGQYPADPAQQAFPFGFGAKKDSRNGFLIKLWMYVAHRWPVWEYYSDSLLNFANPGKGSLNYYGIIIISVLP